MNGAWQEPPPDDKIRVAEDGRIHGADGLLDQVSSAVVKHAGPMIVRDVLPAVREDKPLQRRVGSAAGEAIGRQIAPWIAIGAGALFVMAIVQIVRLKREGQT